MKLISVMMVYERVLLQRNKDLFLEIEEMNKDVIEGKLEMPRDSVDCTQKKDDDEG